MHVYAHTSVAHTLLTHPHPLPTHSFLSSQLHEIDEGLQKLNLAARVLEDLVEEMVEGTSSAAKEEAAEGK